MFPYGTYYPLTQQFKPISYTNYQNLSSACKNSPAYLWVIQPDTAICPVVGTTNPASNVGIGTFASPRGKSVITEE